MIMRVLNVIVFANKYSKFIQNSVQQNEDNKNLHWPYRMKRWTTRVNIEFNHVD